MIARAFAFKQFVAARFAFGKKLAHANFFLVGKAGGHGSRRNEDRGQMAKPQRSDQQARHDLVANAQQHRCLKHPVAERDSGSHRYGISAE